VSVRVLMLVENLSVPLDRRVWQEALSLRRAGYMVTVVCPRGTERDTAVHEVREGIEIHRYEAVFATGSPTSYVREYASALWRMGRLAGSLARKRGFDVVHASNPPDLLLLAALPLRRRGVRLIFDHHDLVPELLHARFNSSARFMLPLAKAFEWISFRLADVVISPNESFRHIAIERGGKAPQSVFVVRNAPDLERFHRSAADPRLRNGKRHLLAYVGMMSPQDGVDHALRALAHLRQRRGDWRAVFVGAGDSLAELRRLAAKLDLTDVVEFSGFLGDADITRILSSADVCLAPEPRNALNDVSTMIKIAEYMSMGRPVVSHDLTETRFTAGPAALYAESGTESAFAARIDELLSDASRRAAMGRVARERVEQSLAWSHSERNLLAAYDYCLRR
jgi:glycosyltransferase involved in cell wall biosynthesis